MTVVDLRKVHGGWWQMIVVTDGVHRWNVRLGTRDETKARQILETHRKIGVRI